MLTGGPGAGKTAILELVRRSFCEHVRVLPEAAGILFGGGFPRGDSPALRRAAQRAIFHTQRELEAVADAGEAPFVLCDRGTVDGLAYWPGPGEFWAEVGTTLAAQLDRYDAVLHVRTPTPEHGYNNAANPLRIESAAEAAAIDERILAAWSAHPRRVVIPAAPEFLAKARDALVALAALLPCCRGDAATLVRTA
ncbi:MAG: ATP-binding protein [Myxococcales bacterium]|nr:ATP-binding protein [Myxococcales bacterium]